MADGRCFRQPSVQITHDEEIFAYYLSEFQRFEGDFNDNTKLQIFRVQPNYTCVLCSVPSCKKNKTKYFGNCCYSNQLLVNL